MAKLISIVVPTYYNSASLNDLFDKLDKINETLISLNVKMEVIAVDDGSKDSTPIDLKKFKEKITYLQVFELTRNFGESTAAKFGLSKISGDAFIVLAADLQDPPELIIDMVKLWLDGYRYIVCEREKRHDPILTKFFAGVYYFFLTKYVISNYPKKGFDLFLMDSKYLPVVIDSSKSSSVPLILTWIGIDPKIIKYVRVERVHGSSRWSFFKRVDLLLDVLFSFSRKPIRLVTTIGGVVAIGGLIFGLSVIIEKLTGSQVSQGTASLIALVSFASGLILLTLGVIAEYIWRIWDEVNKRPNGIEK